MADFVLNSLRGGLNDSDPPMALPVDQCVRALNVEFNRSTMGERRRGGVGIDLTGSALEAHDRVSFLYRNLPTTFDKDAQLWALGVTGTSSATLQYKDTTWHTVAPLDAFTLSGDYQYRFEAVTIHGKMFLAYKSAVNRLHVWDGTNLRRAGLAQPAAAPTAANSGGVGTLIGTRYYRVRYTVQAAGVTLRRSEPSDVLTFAPSTTNLSITVTKPATISESETHWELEASIDNANFYVIATTVVGTTTVVDSQDYIEGYAQDFELSETIGDYELIPSGEFLVVDEDRLLIGGSFDDEALSSRVSWTPVYNDPGSGNDERIPVESVNFRDLDTYEGGRLTGMSAAANGYVFVFKRSHIYKMVRSGKRSNAYDIFKISTDRGALRGSVVSGIDQFGRPCVYFLDPSVGPCRVGAGGVQHCGADIWITWQTVNLDATRVTCRALYDPVNRQVQWRVATDDANIPDFGLTLQTNECREGDNGVRRGWSVWDGDICGALAMCLYSNNIDDDTDRNNILRPFIATEGNGLVWQCDTGGDDNGTEFEAVIQTRPYTPTNILNQFFATSGALLAKAQEDAVIDVTITADFGMRDKTPPGGVALDPTAAGESYVIKKIDNLKLGELKVVQITFADTSPPSGERWELGMFALKESKGATGT